LVDKKCILIYKRSVDEMSVDKIYAGKMSVNEVRKAVSLFSLGGCQSKKWASAICKVPICLYGA
jgi:hypothetical protein